jgi:hypothetical protein
VLPAFPLALRWNVFLSLFAIVVILETIALVLLIQPRLRMVWIALLANIITSCLLAPYFALRSQGWREFPLLTAAYEVRYALQEGRPIWTEALVWFVAMFFVFGLPTIAIEGTLVRYLTNTDRSKAWSAVSLANVVSYLFLTLWSCYIGFQMRTMEWEEAQDYVYNNILVQPSEGEFLRIKWIGWGLFGLVLLVCLFVMLLGNKIHQAPQDRKVLAPALRSNNIALVLGLLSFGLVDFFATVDFDYPQWHHPVIQAAVLYVVFGGSLAVMVGSGWPGGWLRRYWPRSEHLINACPKCGYLIRREFPQEENFCINCGLLESFSEMIN